MKKIANLYNFTIYKISAKSFTFYAFHKQKHHRGALPRSHDMTSQIISIKNLHSSGFKFTWSLHGPFNLQNKAEKVLQPINFLGFGYLHK